MSSSQLPDWAACLAEAGWAVFPLLPGSKRPALHGHRTCPGTGPCQQAHRGWEQRATTDSERIARCWAEDRFNIGVATGPSGLVVLDLDQPGQGQRLPDRWRTLGVHTGTEVLDTLARRAGEPLPETYTVTTPSGGKHLYFRAPAGVELRNTAGVLGPLVDTRAHGGYVVAPGSITPDGAYELLDDTEPAELPGWLAQALVPAPSVAISAPRESAPRHVDRYVAAALRNEADHVAHAPSGRQNQTLFHAALALGRLVATGALDDTTARHTLHEAMSRLPNTRPHEPWAPADIDNTITSAFRIATTRPRRSAEPAHRSAA